MINTVINDLFNYQTKNGDLISRNHFVLTFAE